MLNPERTKNALESFSKNVVKRSRYNLTRQKKNVSKNLYESLKGVTSVSKNSIEVSFEMLDYGKFQDEGVNGKKVNHGSKYSYKDKMPPASAFDRWTVRRGLAPRDQGKFTSRKSLNFAIARSIFLNGIKPTFFFTKPFTQEFNKLPDELLNKFGLDVESFLKSAVDNGSK